MQRNAILNRFFREGRPGEAKAKKLKKKPKNGAHLFDKKCDASLRG